jgi:hypothetical protein
MTNSGNGSSPFAWRFLNLKQILEKPVITEAPWRVRNLIASGCGTLISAHPHGMKSFTWLQAAIDAPMGNKVWGHFPVTGVSRTLYIETEDPEWLLTQRIQQLARGMSITPADVKDAGCFTLGCLGPFDIVGMGDMLKSSIDKYKPDFTVLSTLQGLLAGRNWKEQDEMHAVNALMVDISTHYSPLATITHSPWNKKEKRAAGTITQAANYQTSCHYQKYQSRDGTTKVTVDLDSKIGADATESSFKLRLNSFPERDGLRFDYEVSHSREEIENHIKAHPKESPLDISVAFGISERWARKLKSAIASA